MVDHPKDLPLPMALSTANSFLSSLLGQWHEQLTDWAFSGRLTSAVQESLLLGGEPQMLKELVAQLAVGDYKAIPEIMLLPSTAMNGAMGAYAAGTGHIFLNADWLQNATSDQVILVLTEELGHHLDVMLNQADTPGDEGELLARLLANEKLSLDQIALIESDQDRGKVFTGDQIIQVEQAALAKVSVTVLANGKESDASPVVFGFQRNGDISGPLSVIYRLYGTANAGTDYIGATSGTVNFAAGSSSATLSLPALADVVIDPGETVIAQISPSGAYAITPGQQTATATITAEGVEVSVKAGQLLGTTSEYSNMNAFAALKSDGSVVAWGDSFSGGTTPFGLTGVTQIYSGNGAFAALKSDGSVVAWGDSAYGGIAPEGLSDVTKIFSNANAFVALKSDGHVVAWGKSDSGGTAPAELNQVNQISSSGAAFAALKDDGSVVSWGDSRCGGISPSGLSGVNHIFSNPLAFAALKTDGTVVAWGDSLYGGTAPSGLSGVTEISSTLSAFAALKSDGSVVAWGDSELGATIPPGLTDVTKIYSNYGAFTALKSDGSIVSWGNDVSGGMAPSGVGGVTQIFSTFLAFAALRSDGSVVCWGKSDYGGIAPTGLTGVKQIYATPFAFAALKSDGSVVAWGDSAKGGTAPAGLSGVTQIFSSGYAFAALKSDGSVVAWGDSFYGGTAPEGLTGVVGFANPLTDDHLLLKPIINWVSVVSMANGNEADGSPVVFRFSRNGNTSDPLTVSYRLFGTAQAGLDYTGITTGSITFQAGSSTAQLALSALADGALIDPGETIIARIDTSTLYGITPGQQIATATITAEGVAVSVKDGSSWSGEPLNSGAFAAIKSDGSVVAWGTSRFGGTAPSGLTGVSQIYSNGNSFVALKFDGTVVNWGDSAPDDVLPPSGLDKVQIVPNWAASAALKSDGSVVAWGTPYWGGTAPAGLSGVIQIYSNVHAFAALKSDGSVVAWGSSYDGGSSPSDLNGVVAISSTRFAFAALKSDGTVVGWGSGGAAPTGLSDVTKIYSSGSAFAALKRDGSVVTWGDFGNSRKAPYGLSSVTQIYSNEYAFAALTADGSVVAWGEGLYGGSAPTGLTGVAQIFSTERAFAALKLDGTVVAWGDQYSGGRVPQHLNNVTQIFSNDYAFAALKRDGTVVAWGDYSYGGLAPSGLSSVTQIYSSGSSFAALKSDGSVEAWGGNGVDSGNEPPGLKGVVAFANPLTDDRLIPPPTFLTPSASIIDEALTLSTTVYTSQYAPGTTLYWSLSGEGITSADFSLGALKGSGVIGAKGTFGFDHTLAEDLTTEGDERLEIKLFFDPQLTLQCGPTLAIVIQDTSKAPVYTPITTVGSVVFQKAVGSNSFSVVVDGLTRQITIQGNPIYEGIYPDWQTISAATINGANTVLWRNTASNRLHTWTTDSNWRWLSSQGSIEPNSKDGYTLESQFKLDLNQDNIIGSPYSTITTVGSVVFQKAVGSNRYSVDVGGLINPITIQGNPIYEGIYPDWQTVSAATINGVNTVLWRNTASNRLHTWTTDANWKWLSSQGWINPDSSEGFKLESQFRIDLNHDSWIGQPLSPI